MEAGSQKRAPVYEALEQLKKRRVVPFDVPGHKRGRGNPELVELLGEKCVSLDVNSMKPLDNLCHPVSVIKEAEELAAEVAFPPEIGKLVLKGRENRKIAVDEVAALLAKQNLDPSGPDYGAFPAVKKGPKLVNLLEIAAGEPAEGKNPYYGHPALIRRLLLARIPQLVKLSAAYRFDGSDL